MAKSKQLTGALGLALILSAGSTYVLGKRLMHPGATQIKTRQYLSTKRPIEPGEIVRSDDVQTIAWPASDAVEGALSKADEVVGRTVLYPLAPGQPVLNRELAQPGSGPGLASKIPNGMRAIALKSDEVVGVAGFLVPGSHVDVLATYGGTQTSELSTATVLQNAEIVAAGQQMEPDPQGKAVSTTVVTLLLNPQQAESALLASSQGALHFVLRNNADKTVVATAPVTLSELTGVGGARSGETAARPTSGILSHRRAAPKVATDEGVEIVLGAGGAGEPGATPETVSLPKVHGSDDSTPQPASGSHEGRTTPGATATMAVTGVQP